MHIYLFLTKNFSNRFCLFLKYYSSFATISLRLTYKLNCFSQYLDTLFVKDPQAGMDYHELQVKLANRDKELCAVNQSQLVASARKRITSMKARENIQPKRKRGKTQECAGKRGTGKNARENI